MGIMIVKCNTLMNFITLLEKDASFRNAEMDNAISSMRYSWELSEHFRWDSTYVMNELNQRVSLRSLMEHEACIFFFDGKTCWDCINSELENFEELLLYFEKENVKIVAKNLSAKVLFNDNSFAKWRGQLYIITDSGNQDQPVNKQIPVPYIIHFDGSGQIKSVYVSPKFNDRAFNEFKLSLINRSR